MGGREYFGCIAVLAVLSLMSGLGFAAVAGTVLSLFIVLLVVGAIAFAAWVASESRRS